MKAITLMYDSLNRHMLPPYGCDWIHAPNFARLAEKTVTFDSFYAGSLPCIPARRELHTGRVNFLHRCWGPLEPFDDSMPELLKKSGVYTHLISDHFHYWEDGGASYHTRFNTWEVIRGQAGDPWIGQVKDPEVPDYLGNRTITNMTGWRNDWVNRPYIEEEGQRPQSETMDRGLSFIRNNQHQDNWYLHLETFDPHEPFWSEDQYEKLYLHNYDGPQFDWPDYAPVKESEAAVEHCRMAYAALVSMCDAHLGRLLDLMDELDMWKDTMLMVNVDHGFLLGEHGWWGKKTMPFYEEIVHTPFFLWHPDVGFSSTRNDALCQTIDIAPTLLDYFDVPVPSDMQGVPLRQVMLDETVGKEAILYGQHGMHVNCYDGRYVYMRGPKDSTNLPLFNHTLMPMHMKSRFSVEEMMDYELSGPFDFTKGLKLIKIQVKELLPDKAFLQSVPYETMLFDLKEDPEQQSPIDNPMIEKKMIALMVGLMKENDAPKEQFERLGLMKHMKK